MPGIVIVIVIYHRHKPMYLNNKAINTALKRAVRNKLSQHSLISLQNILQSGENINENANKG
jgi:hypothetical protein